MLKNPHLLVSDKNRSSWYWDILCVCFFSMLFFSFYLGSFPFFTPDEGRYSEVAREMLASGDYITPRVNGIVFLDKPVLFYWFQSAAISVFGVTEWAVRFFPMVFGVIGCIVTYFSGRFLYSRTIGIFSAIILATSPLYFAATHYANLDLEVAVLISNSLLFFLCALHTDKWRKNILLFLSYACAGLAVLTKGLIGIVFPILIIGTWILVTLNWRIIKQIHLIKGLALILLIVSPWYLLVQKQNPEFFHYFFVTQHFSRFFSVKTFNNPNPFWFYVPVVIGGFFPWIIYLLQPLKRKFLDIRKNQSTTATFLALWIGLIFCFFSIPHTKIITYILPIFPAMALLSGYYLAHQASKKMSYILIVCNVFVLALVPLNAGKFNTHTVKPLTHYLKPLLQTNDEIIHYDNFYQDAPLYLEKKGLIVADWESPYIENKDNWQRELWYGKNFKNSEQRLLTFTEFTQLLNKNQRFFIFLNIKDLEKLKTQTPVYLLKKFRETVLVSNKPVTG